MTTWTACEAPDGRGVYLRWIDYLTGRSSYAADRLEDLLRRRRIIVGGIILLEVMLGFRYDAHTQVDIALLRPTPFVVMLGEARALAATVRYRRLRAGLRLDDSASKRLDEVHASRQWRQRHAVRVIVYPRTQRKRTERTPWATG